MQNARTQYRFNEDDSLKKWLIVGIVCSLSFGLPACTEAPPYPKTPTAVVQTLFAGIGEFKDAQKSAKENGATDETAKGLAESKAALDSLFLNPKNAKLIMMPLLLLDLEDVDFVEETIDGDSAEVTIEHTVVGFGQTAKLEESAQNRKRITFQLKKEQGCWLISDIGGTLQKFGR